MRRDHAAGGGHHDAPAMDRLEDVVDVGQPRVGDEHRHLPPGVADLARDLLGLEQVSVAVRRS